MKMGRKEETVRYCRHGPTFVLMLLVLASPHQAIAQVRQTTLRVETFVAPPFIVQQTDGLTGFSIDLWKEIATRLRVETTYQVAPTPELGLRAMRAGQADLAVAPVFITVERDKEFDFSYSILEAGQQVMVREAGKVVTAAPFQDLTHLLLSPISLEWLGGGLVLLLLPAHIVWLVERRYKNGIIPTQRYFPGIFHAAFWAAATLLNQAEQAPRQWFARVVALLWMFAGVVFVALYTAQLTTTLTVQEIRGLINGPEDLPGKKVGTAKQSVSAKYLLEHDVKPQEFEALPELWSALLDRKIDAVLLNAPLLRYYEAHEGKGLVEVVGPEFDRGQIALMFPLNSPLRREVNAVLVAMREDGTYQRIYDTWFGSDVSVRTP